MPYSYTTGTLGTLQSTVNYGYGNSEWKDQLTSYNGTTITYDASGNPLNWRNASSMNWTGRQLDSMMLSNGTNVSFQYNSDGLRVSKMVGSNTVKYHLYRLGWYECAYDELHFMQMTLYDK